jgi:NNP family nitrate/nitrite transporter-like MFS transporter
MNDDAAEGENPKAPFCRVIPALLLLASVFLLNFISRIIFSPLLPEIQQDMQLAHSVAGSFFLFISAGYFISILLSGTVSSRLGHKWTIVVSAVGCGLMLSIVGFCTSVIAMRIAMFCLGYAAGLYLRSGLATITRLVAPAYLARGVAIHELAPNIGFVTAPLLSGIMLYYFSWREGLQILGLILGGMGLIYALSGKGNGRKEKKKDFSLVRRLLVDPQFWLMVLLFSFAICSTLGIYAMLPLYLVTEHGMEHDAANRLVALSRVSSVFMPLVAGWFGDRFGNSTVMLIVLFIAGILTIPLGIFTGFPLLVFVVLQPMVAVCFFPSGFAVLSGIGGREATGSAISLCIPVAFLIGGGAIPMVIGGVGDYYSLAAGFIGTGCFITFVAAAASWIVWIGQKRAPFQ